MRLRPAWRAALGAIESADVPGLAAPRTSARPPCGVWFVAPKAWYAAAPARAGHEPADDVAVAGAVAIGEWFEAATVAFLFALSLALEAWSVGRARRAVAALMDLAPPTARLLGPTAANEEVLVPQRWRSARSVLVKPGERIPARRPGRRGRERRQPGADHRRERARSPRKRATRCSPARSTATARSRSSPPSRARHARSPTSSAMVDEAQRAAPPSEQWVERFARVYTPAVMAARGPASRSSRRCFGGAWATGSTARWCCWSSPARARW